jgi:hypothetical protein
MIRWLVSELSGRMSQSTIGTTSFSYIVYLRGYNLCLGIRKNATKHAQRSQVRMQYACINLNLVTLSTTIGAASKRQVRIVRRSDSGSWTMKFDHPLV